MSGRYPHRWGGQSAVAIQNTENYFPTDQVTLATRLRACSLLPGSAITAVPSFWPEGTSVSPVSCSKQRTRCQIGR